jgi:hypothetical protein
MHAASFRNFQFGLMLVTALSCAALWSEAADAYTFDQQQACSGDAFRICSSEIPDVDRITACMAHNRDQLSPGCRAFFKDSESDAVQRDDGAPVNVRPASVHRHVKPHRVKRLVKRDAT